MRDYNSVANILSEDAIYKDVVVIGNGPSGIVLSYLLAGNLPYYNGDSHPDELLTARLKASPPGESLIQQDLRFLSQGLEGRTSNPVSLLMDTLHHPCADLGLEIPSLLKWQHHPEKQVDHIVLGKGPPGGAWQAMDGNVLTISLGSWMELPGLDFRTWESCESIGSCSSRDSRAPSSTVARYYADYVRTLGLNRHFRNNCIVTSVRPLDTSHCAQCNESIDPETGVVSGHLPPRWCVEGFNTVTNAPFTYVSRQVVLATGSCDLPNRLGVPGELTNRWVLHELRELEEALDNLVEKEGKGGSTERSCDPVLIVGAGLSAADAVIAARFRSLPILHVFRKRAITLEKQLPENMYPEYHKVHQMMGDTGASYPHYTALPEHRVLDLSPDHKVTFMRPDGTVAVQHASIAAILIGSRPDLSFLRNVPPLGVRPDEPVDCRSNPVAVDPFTYEVARGPAGLYAMGPLAGDGFVRFIQGGAVAIASTLHAEAKKGYCEVG